MAARRWLELPSSASADQLPIDRPMGPFRFKRRRSPKTSKNETNVSSCETSGYASRTLSLRNHCERRIRDFAGLFVFKHLTALSFRAVAACTLSTPKGLSGGPWSSLKSRRGDESLPTKPQERSSRRRPLPGDLEKAEDGPSRLRRHPNILSGISRKGKFFQPSGFPRATGDPIASPMARGPKPNRHLCWRPLERVGGHCGLNSGFARKNRSFALVQVPLSTHPKRVGWITRRSPRGHRKSQSPI